MFKTLSQHRESEQLREMGIKKDREHELLDKGKDTENQKLMFSTANYTSMPNVVKTLAEISVV